MHRLNLGNMNRNTPVAGNTIDVKIALINCETNLILTWSSTCAITYSTNAGTFVIFGTKLYVSVVTL